MPIINQDNRTLYAVAMRKNDRNLIERLRAAFNARFGPPNEDESEDLFVLRCLRNYAISVITDHESNEAINAAKAAAASIAKEDFGAE